VINETCLPTRPDLKLIVDCWHNEPHITPATLAAAQLATPHIAGYSAEANLRGSFVLYQALCAHFGRPETFRYDDLLPPAPAALRLPNPQRPLHALLRDLLFQTTPLAHLDRALRTAAGDTSTVFKQLRSTCQHRREWSAYRVSRDGITEAVQQTLSALGFRFI
jgi:erythronate-4-phosphate dehydrogenase